MDKTDKLLEIAKLLGEDNAKRLQDELTDFLLYYLKDDVESMSEYLIDFEDLFAEVRKEVFTNVKDKMIKKYTEEIETKFEELTNQKYLR